MRLKHGCLHQSGGQRCHVQTKVACKVGIYNHSDGQQAQQMAFLQLAAD